MISPGDDFDELFRSFRHEAWRWECQGTYREPDEAEPWRRWRQGEPDDLEWLRPWLDEVRTAVCAGKTFARVRVFDEPLTEYQRWQVDVSAANVGAGEDMRILTRNQARYLRLPDHDFWLFDEANLARMHFEAGQFVGPEIVTSPAEVDRYRRWKAIAWQHAVPFDVYVQRISQRSR